MELEYTTEHKPEHTVKMDFGRATRRLLRKVRAGALGGVTGRETPTHNSSAHFRLGCVANPILQDRVSAQYAPSSDGQSWNINYKSTCSATGVRKKRWTRLAVMALSRRLDRPKRRAGRVTEENLSAAGMLAQAILAQEQGTSRRLVSLFFFSSVFALALTTSDADTVWRSLIWT